MTSGFQTATVVPFWPAFGIQSGNAQTIVSAFLPNRVRLTNTVPRRLPLDDGDVVILHDDCPSTWNPGEHSVLLMHGLAGCHRSGYMVRLADKLFAEGVRVFRLDHRGCGAGRMLAVNPYHAGRIQDVATAVNAIVQLCPGSPVSVAGFSLSGNLLLKYLATSPVPLPANLFRAVAVCPPVDLQQCVEQLGQTRMGRRYDRYFARRLVRTLAGTPQWRDDVPLARSRRVPQRLIEFDEMYTAPASGFESAAHYYATASSLKHLERIPVSTTILAAKDDPMVCSRPLQEARLPPNIRLCMSPHGGHLGFIARRNSDPDRRWMDWRVIEWLLNNGDG